MYVMLCVLACGGVAAVLAVTSHTLVRFFFGQEFAAAGSIMRVLLLSAVLFSLRRVLNDCARGLGKPEFGAVAELSSWLTAVPALAILATQWHEVGVAWSMVLVPTVSCVVLGGLIARELMRSSHADNAKGPLDQFSMARAA
jgi:Na+-driven multidrug efflux pump